MSGEVMVIQRHCPDEAYTDAMARGVADALMPGDVVALQGDLGAGKTTFARSLARAMGADAGLVSSPTFVVVNEYPLATPVRGIRRVVHADAYRLHGADDLDALGWDRFTKPDRHAADDAVLLVEWPSKIDGALPTDHAAVRLEPDMDPVANPTVRRMTLRLPGAWRARPAAEMLRLQQPLPCRITGRLVHPTNQSYPFVDDRAKMADLNRWFTGSYSIGRPIKPEDEPQE